MWVCEFLLSEELDWAYHVVKTGKWDTDSGIYVSCLSLVQKALKLEKLQETMFKWEKAKAVPEWKFLPTKITKGLPVIKRMIIVS